MSGLALAEASVLRAVNALADWLDRGTQRLPGDAKEAKDGEVMEHGEVPPAGSAGNFHHPEPRALWS